MANNNFSYHSICRWTFNPGKGGFVPSNIRPEFGGKFSTADMIRLTAQKVRPRMPEHVKLGIEVHYDAEVDEKTAPEIADAMVSTGLHLALITPGAHIHFAYGGISSLDADERKAAEGLGTRAVDIAYGPLRKAWHPDEQLAPAYVLWNGSYGYDIATVGIRRMYQNLKESVAGLCQYEAKKGGLLRFAFEPKPNEGHPAMLIPTVASAILFWRKLEEEFGVPRANKGVNKEFGHSEMIGLDHVYDTVEEIDNDAVMHMHLNSQGYNDGIILGGPGKFDIDHGCRINGFNLAIAGLVQEAGYARWKGHDMQPRPYDNAEQAVDRVVRSVLSWEACAKAAAQIDVNALMALLAARQAAKAEDLMRHAVVAAQKYFDEYYG
ncbi:MAG TPA: xylose isomerase [Candidatus Bathyarchaeia archaeon]|nr:xylose isomerase [Candidatus Bathyarchaeia archaeon]